MMCGKYFQNEQSRRDWRAPSRIVQSAKCRVLTDFPLMLPPFVSSNYWPAIYSLSMGTRGEQNAHRVERRKSPRIPFRFPVRMKIMPAMGRESDTAQYIHVQGHDLSECGISIICARKLEVGQELELEMPGRIRAAVVRCVESKERGRYLIGCQFINEHPSASSSSPPAV